MPNLYELMGEYDELQKLAEDEVGTEEQLTELLDRIDEAKGSLRDKVDAICRVLSNLSGTADMYKVEEKRLGKRRKAIENNVERLREWLRGTMNVLDVHEMKTDLHKVQLQAGPPQVVVVDEKLVPEKYVKVTTSVDKRKVMATYKEDGQVVTGCDIVEGKKKLVIR